MRIHADDEGTFVWIVNPTRSQQTGRIRFAGGAAEVMQMHWEAADSRFNGVRFEIPSRNLVIAKIRMTAP